MNAAAEATQTKTASSRGLGALLIGLNVFPTRLIADNPRIASWTAKAIWLLLPLQYYVFLNNHLGLRDPDSFTPTASLLLIAILSIFAISFVIALAESLLRGRRPPQRDAAYSERIRVWSTALLVTWGASFVLQALAILLTRLLEYSEHLHVDLRGLDLVNFLVAVAGLDVSKNPLAVLLANLIYSVAAVSIVSALLRGLGAAGNPASAPSQTAQKKDKSEGLPMREPDAVTVALINTALTTTVFCYTGGLGKFGWVYALFGIFPVK